MFWEHEADGSRILVLRKTGGRYEKLAAVSRGPVRGWVIQSQSGMLIGCEKFRKKAMRQGEAWILDKLHTAHLAGSKEKGVDV
jgi:hypothetical protein